MKTEEFERIAGYLETSGRGGKQPDEYLEMVRQGDRSHGTHNAEGTAARLSPKGVPLRWCRRVFARSPAMGARWLFSAACFRGCRRENRIPIFLRNRTAGKRGLCSAEGVTLL